MGHVEVPVEEKHMKLITTKQTREIDRIAIEELGIPGTTLMSKAAEHIANAAMERLPPDGCVAVFCGTGNNGGDGIGAAAYLLVKGVSVRVFLVANIYDELPPDSEVMKTRLLAAGGSVEHYLPSADLVDYVDECSVVIDAIFGIGLKSDLQGDALSAVSVINSSHTSVISVDIPSGVHADTGAILGDAVKADLTLTFSLAKPGHFVEPGCIYCGELRVCSIGIPQKLLDNTVSHMYAAMQHDIHLPRRRRDTHKGDYGRTLVVAGSVGYTGAPALSARAATKMGNGLVSLGVPKSIYEIMAVKLTEEMPFPLPEDNKGRLVANAASEILRRASLSDVCLIGPGLGASPDISELVQSLVRLSNTPIVLDADGLNAIAGNIEILNQVSCPLILTPHPGEFERLGGKLSGTPPLTGSLPDESDDEDFLSEDILSDISRTVGEVSGHGYDDKPYDDDPYDDNTYENINYKKADEKKREIKNPPVDRLRAACDFASKYGCILVLKGHRTIIALPNGIAYVNTTGGPAMAKGGTGDVLAGMITALIAQKLPIVHAVAAAVYIHGLAGDMCAEKLGEYCVTASDIIDMLPQAIKKIETV